MYRRTDRRQTIFWLCVFGWEVWWQNSYEVRLSSSCVSSLDIKKNSQSTPVDKSRRNKRERKKEKKKSLLLSSFGAEMNERMKKRRQETERRYVAETPFSCLYTPRSPGVSSCQLHSEEESLQRSTMFSLSRGLPVCAYEDRISLYNTTNEDEWN